MPGNHSGSKTFDDHIRNFEAAERCQRNIANTTAKTSPFRRYNIILDELKREVILRLGKPVGDAIEPGPVPLAGKGFQEGLQRKQFEDSVSQGANLGLPVMTAPEQLGTNMALTNQVRDNAQFDLRTASNEALRAWHDPPLLGLELFEANGDLDVGWLEFDSCVSLSISSCPAS